ncbi:MAG: cytochrome c5 family protein [Thiohalomonadaceae bacterium]
MSRKFLIAVLGLTACANLSAQGLGEQVYRKSCALCHDTGVMQTPKLGDKAAWAPLVAKGQDALLATVKSGKAAMPPKAACVQCTDDDFRAAIGFMLDAAR